MAGYGTGGYGLGPYGVGEDGTAPLAGGRGSTYLPARPGGTWPAGAAGSTRLAPQSGAGQWR